MSSSNGFNGAQRVNKERVSHSGNCIESHRLELGNRVYGFTACANGGMFARCQGRILSYTVIEPIDAADLSLSDELSAGTCMVLMDFVCWSGVFIAAHSWQLSRRNQLQSVFKREQ